MAGSLLTVYGAKVENGNSREGFTSPKPGWGTLPSKFKAHATKGQFGTSPIKVRIGTRATMVEGTDRLDGTGDVSGEDHLREQSKGGTGEVFKGKSSRVAVKKKGVQTARNRRS